MSLSLASAVILAITLGIPPEAPYYSRGPSSPPIDGKWELLTFMSDGVPLQVHRLQDTETLITDGVMTFPFPFCSPSVQKNRQLHFEFVENGLDVTCPAISHTTPLKGTWSLDGQTLQFCYATDEKLGRPGLSAGKGLVYVMLKRSARDAEKSAQETRTRVVAQLKEIVREDGSTETGRKVKEVLKTLGYDVCSDGNIYPTGTFIFTVPFLR